MIFQILDANCTYDSDRNPSLGGMWWVERLFWRGPKKENAHHLG